MTENLSNGHQIPEITLEASLVALAQRVKLVLTDVDGVLTSSHVIYDGVGVRLRAFSTRDGAAMQWLAQSGIPVGFISALDDPSSRRRAMDLGVEELHLGARNKLATLKSILEKRGLQPQEVAYFGDDLMDLPVLQSVGFPACPADAVFEVRNACALVTTHKGGEGFFRAAAELILKAQGKWEAILEKYSLPQN